MRCSTWRFEPHSHHLPLNVPTFFAFALTLSASTLTGAHRIPKISSGRCPLHNSWRPFLRTACPTAAREKVRRRRRHFPPPPPSPPAFGHRRRRLPLPPLSPPAAVTSRRCRLPPPPPSPRPSPLLPPPPPLALFSLLSYQAAKVVHTCTQRPRPLPPPRPAQSALVRSAHEILHSRLVTAVVVASSLFELWLGSAALICECV